MIPEGSHVIEIMINQKISDPSGVVHEMVIKKIIQSHKKQMCTTPLGSMHNDVYRYATNM